MWEVGPIDLDIFEGNFKQTVTVFVANRFHCASDPVYRELMQTTIGELLKERLLCIDRVRLEMRNHYIKASWNLGLTTRTRITT